jgi:hypothetical protein
MRPATTNSAGSDEPRWVSPEALEFDSCCTTCDARESVGGKDLQLSIRLDHELAARAVALLERLGGLSTRAALLRMAMAEGLAVLEERYKDIPTSAPAQKATKRRTKR